MKKVRLTMAQALLRFLDAQYVSVDGVETKFVQGVMGIFGHGNVTGLGEALERSAGSLVFICLLYTSPSPRDAHEYRMPSFA